MSWSEDCRWDTIVTPWRLSYFTGLSASAIVPVHTSMGCASLRHAPLVIALARARMNTGSSSHNVPHDPPEWSAETSIEQSTRAADSCELGATALGFHDSLAASTTARRRAHLMVYVVSLRGQSPVSTRFQRCGEGSSDSARFTMAAPNGPTAAFVVGAAPLVTCARARERHPMKLTKAIMLACRRVMSTLVDTGHQVGHDRR